jgi:fido (protein-threonine AMPylation protein)
MPEPNAWKSIVDLPADVSYLTSGELDALQLVWEEQKGALEQAGRLDSFHQGLRREWSIETGIVEGVYHLDRGTTQLLIERGIDASLIPHDSSGRDPALVAAIVQDHHDVLEGLFACVKGERALTTGYVKELHAALLRHQDSYLVVDQFGTLFEKRLEKGVYKKSANNPTRQNGSIHTYYPPEHVASEMDRMIALHLEHAEKGIAPEVQAAWLHHVFTQVHPFEDGNGRVARALATLVFIKAGEFPLVVTREDRAKYIDALEKADAGDLKPLIGLFEEIQKRSLLKAIELAAEVHAAGTVDEAVAAARAYLVAKGQAFPREWNRARDIGSYLLIRALTRLHEVANTLQTEIAAGRPGYQFTAGEGLSAASVLVAASQLKYETSLSNFHKWVAMILKTEVTVRFVVSFHGLGQEFRGLWQRPHSFFLKRVLPLKPRMVFSSSTTRRTTPPRRSGSDLG